LVLAHPKAARGRAKGEPFTGRIERKRMAIAIKRELAGM